MPKPQTGPQPMLDFEAIENFWFGNLPEPELPFKPVEATRPLAEPETVELVNPLDYEGEPPEEEEEPPEEEPPYEEVSGPE